MRRPLATAEQVGKGVAALADRRPGGGQAVPPAVRPVGGRPGRRPPRSPRWSAGPPTALVLHESSVTPLAAAGLPPPGDVVLIVGPEGGLTEEELTVFGSAGGAVVRLGPQVLRTSTAGAVALGALGVLTGRWT